MREALLAVSALVGALEGAAFLSRFHIDAKSTFDRRLRWSWAVTAAMCAGAWWRAGGSVPHALAGAAICYAGGGYLGVVIGAGAHGDLPNRALRLTSLGAAIGLVGAVSAIWSA